MAYACFVLNLRLSLSTIAVGNYTNTLVRDNIIYGGFATDNQDASSNSKGTNKEDAIIKSVSEHSYFPFGMLSASLVQDRHCGWSSGLVR